jgi:acetolactate synthase-1/2/3 large subunit
MSLKGNDTARSNRTVAHTIAAALARHGVDAVFGQSIPSLFHLVAPEFGIRQIGYRTENAGAAAADGYARIAQRIGVVTAQNGPAATLLVPGLAEALKASIPVLALVQDVPRELTDKNAFQDLDHLELFKGCAKWIRRVERAGRTEDYVDMAITAATSGRPGPAVLLCPLDLFEEPAPSTCERNARLGHYPLDRMVADPAAVARAADLLAQARRPLVIAGGGVLLSNAQDVLARLQEEMHLPVATTTMGKGSVAEDHPLSVGVVGYYMGARAMARHLRPLVDEADTVLLIGTRTNQNGTDSWKLYPPGATYIHIDIDPAEVGRSYESLRLVGDAKLTLEALGAALRARDLSARQAARPALERRIADARQAYKREAEEMTTCNATPVRPERLMAELDAVLEPTDIVVADASYASIWICNFLRVRQAGMRFLTPRGLAGLGWGLPMAIGAKAAAPQSRVFCIAGDGGFGHVWSELETAKRMRLDVVIIILNNQTLAYQKDAEDVLFGAHTDACHFEPVDHAMIARACGCTGVRVTEPGDFGAALGKALRGPGTTVIDVITDPEAYPPITLFEDRLTKARSVASVRAAAPVT